MMAQPREKPWLKNKNHLDKTENAQQKKPELLGFDFTENNEPAGPESSPRKNIDETTPRESGRKGDESLESNRSPRQEAGDKPSPRGPAADDRSPRAEQGSPRKGDNQGDRRAAPGRDGSDTSDSNDKPTPAARRGGRDQSPEKRERPAAETNGRKPKQSDASPRPTQPYQRPARNAFTGKSTLSL